MARRGEKGIEGGKFWKEGHKKFRLKSRSKQKKERSKDFWGFHVGGGCGFGGGGFFWGNS